MQKRASSAGLPAIAARHLPYELLPDAHTALETHFDAVVLDDDPVDDHAHYLAVRRHEQFSGVDAFVEGLQLCPDFRIFKRAALKGRTLFFSAQRNAKSTPEFGAVFGCFGQKKRPQSSGKAAPGPIVIVIR